MAKKKRRNLLWQGLKMIIAAYLLLVVFTLAKDVYYHLSITHTVAAAEEWNLIVVNRWNELPEDYDVELLQLSNGQLVDERIYPALQAMFDAARAEGVYPIVTEGYRTAQQQQQLYAEKLQACLDEGYTPKRAEKEAKAWVALPGTSEHQLGIAVDINADETKCGNDEVHAWLAENAPEYGFILRYPRGKEEFTGIGYEPWHYRYVGPEAAREISEKGICLEEYLSR